MYGNYSSSAGNAAAGGLGIVFIICWGLFLLIGLALFAFNIWMLVDAIGRQEYEYPGSTGSSKTLWIILLVVGLVIGFGWIVALVYYFKIYKVLKRGSGMPPYGQQPGAPQPPAPMYAPPAPPAYQPPPAPPAYEPPAPPAPPAYEPPPASPVEPAPAPEPPAEPPMAPPAE